MIAYCLTHDRGFWFEAHQAQAGPDCTVVGHDAKNPDTPYTWDRRQEKLVPKPDDDSKDVV